MHFNPLHGSFWNLSRKMRKNSSEVIKIQKLAKKWFWQFSYVRFVLRTWVSVRTPLESCVRLHLFALRTYDLPSYVSSVLRTRLSSHVRPSSHVRLLTSRTPSYLHSFRTWDASAYVSLESTYAYSPNSFLDHFFSIFLILISLFGLYLITNIKTHTFWAKLPSTS